MKLQDCEVIVTAPPAPGWGGRYWILVKLTTNDGITGWGECYAASVGPEAMRAVIADVFDRHMQGESPEHASSVATSKLLPTLKANWVVWPVVHLATFSVVPLAYRVLWVNCANFLWSGFLSAQAHSGSGDAADPKGDDAAGKKKVFNRRSQSVCPKV